LFSLAMSSAEQPESALERAAVVSESANRKEIEK